MGSFIHPSLLWWGLPLVGVPILIHLINLMRHQKVRWAAMEFLLESQKRHKTSVLFKQLLLLLLRMLAVAAIVLMLAQPLVRNQWSAVLGGTKTHHIVLLDDSYSMSDRWAETSAFDQAKQVVDRLANQAMHRNTAQLFTLVRFSRAKQLAKSVQPDLLNAPLDSQFQEKLEQTLGPMRASETAAEPADALAAVDRLSDPGLDEDRIVYIVSDFRTKEWDEPVAIAKTLKELRESGVQLHLVNCVDDPHANLAITALRPERGTRAAEVSFFIEVGVRNYGTTPARQVSVALTEDGAQRPAIVIEDIPPGKTVTRRFPVMFTTAGEHEITAHLQSDAVAADNARSLVVEVAKNVDILVIDGDSKAQDAFFLSTALAPGGKLTSGLRPMIETPRYLRDHALSDFETIYLLNIGRLDEAEIAALEAYVKAGGGLGIFMGEQSRAEFFNSQLYRDGQGLFPLPLAGPAELVVDRLEKSPDLVVTDHPIFAVFAGERNSFIGMVNVTRYFAAPKDWAPAASSSAKVIARLRNRAPLAVEQRFGEGRVVVMLTKASPLETALGSWNNWGRENPSFVVAMLEMQAYLAQSRHPDTSRLVGSPLDIKVDIARYLPAVRFVTPSATGAAALQIDAVSTDDGHHSVLNETDTSGIYQAQLTGTDTAEHNLRFALNVDPHEGNLARLDQQQLTARLPGIDFQYHKAGDINYNPQQLAGLNLSETLLYLLIAILVGEQLLAFACSYHPTGGARG